MRTVRDATFDVLRRLGMTTMFSNPGSTEVPFLADLPDDLEFVLALHEGSVVGMATGWALSRGQPACVLLHTTAGLGNGVQAITTARVNRAPMVVFVGQQDRRHLAQEPFLAGRLEGLAGDYPVWVEQPARAQDVPGAIVRAHHEAMTGQGPAILIVPMGDWQEPAGEPYETIGPERLLRSRAADPEHVEALAQMLEASTSPVIVAGSGADDADTWAALVALAERLQCPVWQEPFGSRAGFPQDHPLFAGHLPPDRSGVRGTLDGHDLVIAVGAPVFRQFAYEPGPLVPEGTRVAVVTDDPAEAHRSPADLALLSHPAAVCCSLAQRTPERSGPPPEPHTPPDPPQPPAPGEPMLAGHVLAALAERLPVEAIVLEETPSNRPELLERLPARLPMGQISPAMGGLGFAMPAAVGLRMGNPERPVVAVIGDGSSMYSIQALWSAARYGAGALFVILANGRYAVMDMLVEPLGSAPWPALDRVDITSIARALGCQAHRIESHDELLSRLDEVLPDLARRDSPLLLEVVVAPDASYRG